MLLYFERFLPFQRQAIKKSPCQILTALKCIERDGETAIYNNKFKVISKKLLMHVFRSHHGFSYVKMLDNSTPDLECD